MRCKVKFVMLSFTVIFFALVKVTGTPPDVGNTEAMQQGIVVTGTVSDDDGSLPGVSVAIKGTTQGVVTDINGKFTITVPNREAVLMFSFVGYATQEIEVGDRIIFDISLAESVKEIEEVVVVGYAVQKKATMVGSVSQAKGEDILRTGAVTTVSQAIQGLMPGVVSIVSTSIPGKDEAEVIIRGRGTWISAKPLYLVDGVERDFNDLDPNEIESISVLKDAAATAVYGVKGGNGVIIVTTKRGLNQRPSVNFTANFGFKRPTTHPEYADYVTAMKMWNEAVHNDMQWSQLIPESKISAWEKAYATGNYGPDNNYFPEVDWWNEMIKPWGPQQQYNLNIRGGSNFVKYFVSFGFLNEGDIYRTEKNDMYNPAHWYKRYNWRTNLDFNLTKTTVFSINLAGKQGNRNEPGYRKGNQEDGLNNNYMQEFFSDLYKAPRNMFPIRWSPDGNPGDGEYGASSDGSGNLKINFNKGQRMHKYYENFIDLGLKQDFDFITKGLAGSVKFSYTTENATQSRIQLHKGENFGNLLHVRYYREYDYSQPLEGGGYALVATNRLPNPTFQGESQEIAYDLRTNGGYGRRMNYEASLSYNRTFGDHAVSLLGVFDRYQNEALKDANNTDMKFQEREEAWVTRATYDFAERYLFEFSGAYTGSMRFARDIRYKFFPSYSVGWRLSEEPFIRNSGISETLSNFKVRYSYGTVGYDRGADFFTYVQTYTVGGPNSGVLLGAGGVSGDRGQPVIQEGQAANANATWETAYKQNLGFDFGLFNNSLTGTVDMFKEKREGLLMNMATPAWFGITEPDANLGKTKSRGIEVELGWNAKIGKDFRYWLKVQFSTNENRIVDRNDPPDEDAHRKQAGKPINLQRRMGIAGYYGSIDDIFNYHSTAGQNTLTPGDFMYIDYNVDGELVNDESDQLPMWEQNYPRNTYGWSMGFSWKNWDFSMMWYGVIGVYKNIVGELLWDLNDGDAGNYYANPDVINRWTPETALFATKPALHSINANRLYNERGSDYTYSDASYLRMKNFEVAYSFDKSLIGKLSMSKCQIYANGNNLLTFTKFNKYIDPEGNSVNMYPMLRRYNFGIRVTF